MGGTFYLKIVSLTYFEEYVLALLAEKTGENELKMTKSEVSRSRRIFYDASLEPPSRNLYFMCSVFSSTTFGLAANWVSIFQKKINFTSLEVDLYGTAIGGIG